MPNPVKTRPIELTLPADKKLLLVIRLTTAGVVARAGVTVDRMDDLKLAVEEACNCLMDQGCAAEKLNICFDLKENGLEIRVSVEADQLSAGNKTQDDLEIEKCILESLVENVEFELRNGWIHAICMTTAAAQ